MKQIVENQVSEGLSLEFKSIKVIEKSQTDVVSKAISAFANSAGGSLILGLEQPASNGNANRKHVIFAGDETNKDRSEWLQSVIERHTFPSVVDYQVHLILSPDQKTYYWIDVGKSPIAPHQASDKIYYKRNGSHSIPMEHFEIDDVRSRNSISDLPVEIDIEIIEGVLADLVIRNRGRRPVTNCQFEIISELNIDKKALSRLTSKGLAFLHRDQKASFHLGSLIQFLQEKNTSIAINFNYVFSGKVIKDRIEFNLGDFNYQAINRDPRVQELKEIRRSIDKLSDRLQKIGSELSTISKGFSSAGLHISESSIAGMRGLKTENERTYFIGKADTEGLRDLLGVSHEQALNIIRAFNFVGGEANRMDDLLKDIPKEKIEILKSRFEL